MGLEIPDDLSAWQAKHARTDLARRAVHALRSVRQGPPAEPVWTLTQASERPGILLVLDSTSPTTLAANLRPATFLESADVAILSAAPLGAHRPAGDWHERSVRPSELAAALIGVRRALASGHYLPLGAAVHRWSQASGAAYLIAQHGLMTPLAPPLPANAHLLAWSQADAAFWASGRSDVRSTVVGSQLLHEVVTGPQRQVDQAATPIYLGQLHGAELPRRDLARAAYRFCRQTGATYRPHPAERDKLSRLIHAAWERRGITIDRSGSPLAQVDRPVVSVFSTGVLEAAARGVPSWVDFERPPPWLVDFWHRYGMSTWGGPPTPAPPSGADEPAALIARELLGA